MVVVPLFHCSLWVGGGDMGLDEDRCLLGCWPWLEVDGWGCVGSAGWALRQRRPYIQLPLRKKRQVSLSSSWHCFCSSFLLRSLSASLRI